MSRSLFTITVALLLHLILTASPGYSRDKAPQNNATDSGNTEILKIAMGHYLNFTDKIFICSYGSIFLSVLLTVIMIYQHENNMGEKAGRTFGTGLWLVPSITLISYLIVIVTM